MKKDLFVNVDVSITRVGPVLDRFCRLRESGAYETLQTTLLEQRR